MVTESMNHPEYATLRSEPTANSNFTGSPASPDTSIRVVCHPGLSAPNAGCPANGLSCPAEISWLYPLIVGARRFETFANALPPRADW